MAAAPMRLRRLPRAGLKPSALSPGGGATSGSSVTKAALVATLIEDVRALDITIDDELLAPTVALFAPV